jgi:hypothetical protein
VDDDFLAIGKPTAAARLCAVVLALWAGWAKELDLPPHLLTVGTEHGKINLIAAAEKALADFRAQHGTDAVEAERLRKHTEDGKA